MKTLIIQQPLLTPSLEASTMLGAQNTKMEDTVTPAPEELSRKCSKTVP